MGIRSPKKTYPPLFFTNVASLSVLPKSTYCSGYAYGQTPLYLEPMKQIYTAADIQNLLTDVTFRELDHWARTGLITPSVSDANGRGSRRIYDDTDLLILRIVNNLKLLGATRKLLKRVVTSVRKNGELMANKDTRTLVVTQDDIRLLDDNSITNVLAKSTCGLFVNLQAIPTQCHVSSADRNEDAGGTHDVT